MSNQENQKHMKCPVQHLWCSSPMNKAVIMCCWWFGLTKRMTKPYCGTFCAHSSFRHKPTVLLHSCKTRPQRWQGAPHRAGQSNKTRTFVPVFYLRWRSLCGAAECICCACPCRWGSVWWIRQWPAWEVARTLRVHPAMFQQRMFSTCSMAWILKP